MYKINCNNAWKIISSQVVESVHRIDENCIIKFLESEPIMYKIKNKNRKDVNNEIINYFYKLFQNPK